MALRGKTDELGLLPCEPERDEEVLRLLDRAAQVVLGVHDQERRLDVTRVERRGVLCPRVEVVIEGRAEFAGEVPEEVTRAVGGDQVVDRAFRAGGPESVRM